MRSVGVVVAGLVCLCLVLVSSLRGDAPDAAGGGAAGGQRHRAVNVGNVTLNPYDIIAVYRPVEQQGVAVYIGRTGHGVQTIVFRDTKEAAAVFNELWDNNDLSKDPGDDDNRPLTRMCPKDAEHKSQTLLVNINRVMAVVWSTDHRHVRVYLDKLLANEPLADPNGNDASEALEIQSVHDEAENVMAAYKACVLRH